MRILEMNYEFPPVGGGGGKATEDLAAELSKLGHSIRVLTARQGNLPRLETGAGFEVERIFAFRRQRDRCSVWEMIGYILMAVPAGLRSVRKFRPDAIHAHFAVPTGFAAWLVAKLSGTPYVLTAHLGDVPGGTPEQTDKFFCVIKPLTRPIWHHAAAVTAVSSFVGRLARDAYGLEAIVIPNGVDVDKPPGIPRAPGKTIKLIFAGRLVAQKILFGDWSDSPRSRTGGGRSTCSATARAERRSNGVVQPSAFPSASPSMAGSGLKTSMWRCQLPTSCSCPR